MILLIISSKMAREKLTEHSGAKFRLWETALNVKADPIETSEFLVAAKECIEEGDACEVVDLLSNAEFQELTQYVGWEIIDVVFPYLEEDSFRADCIKILNIICKVCSPKEVLLGLNEQLHELISIECLLYCLQFMQKALLHLAQRKGKFIKMTFDDVSKQFRRFTKRSFQSALKKDIEEEESSFEIADEEIGKEERSETSGDKQVQRKKIINETKTCVVADNTQENDHKSMKASHIHDDLIGKRLCCMITAGLDFICPFIENIQQFENNYTDSTAGKDNEEDVRLICQAALLFVFNILDCPLSWYELPDAVEGDADACSVCSKCNHSARSIAQATMEFIFKFKMPFVSIMEYQMDESFLEEGDENNPEVLAASKAIMCHFILIKDIGSLYFPFILSPQLLVNLCMKPMVSFLKRTDEVGAANALAFGENLMSRLENSVLSCQNVEQPGHLEFFEMLIDIMVYRDDIAHRKRALVLLKQSLQRYVSKGRLVLLRKLLMKVSHPGASGVLIQCVVKEADLSLTKPATENPENFATLRSCFAELLQLSLSPITASGFDPLFQSDRVLVSLNLLRFLLLRDARNDDKFTVCDNLVRIEEKYLDPLRKAINISRSNYTGLLRETLEEKNSGNKRVNSEDDEGVTLSVTVDGCDISQLSCEQKLEQIQNAFNTLDIMDSLLSRVSEIFKEKKKPCE